jgi:diadenosine tetraphosphate (Ap4A) HIT family hydrolase
MAQPVCELCEGDGGEIIFRHEKWRVARVVDAEGAAYQGFCRVIWNAHVKEMTDLTTDDRKIFMDAVFALEAALRQALRPEKMNLASLGNLTPHLHWHVIPRFRDDPAFPKPVWAISAQAAPSLDTLGNKQETMRAHADQAWVALVARAFATN